MVEKTRRATETGNHNWLAGDQLRRSSIRPHHLTFCSIFGTFSRAPCHRQYGTSVVVLSKSQPLNTTRKLNSMSHTKRKAPGPGPMSKETKKLKLDKTAAAPKNSPKKNEFKQTENGKRLSEGIEFRPRDRSADERPLKVSKAQKGKLDPNAEVEWDSDPIEESETEDESGADDGVSWPSADEGNGIDPSADADGYEDVFEDEEMQEDDEGNVEDGGADLANTHPDRAQNIAGKTTSREAHQKQKETMKERKAAKPNANEIQRAKKLWERLRLQSKVPKEERKKLVAELFVLIIGRVKEFVLKHDAGRTVQTALKYGTPQQKRDIAKELQGAIVECAESKYAKFMIGKLVSYGDKEIRDVVVPEFYGKVRRCMRHPEASWILDDIYRAAATKEQKARLLTEWYGPEFSLFKNSDSADVTGELKNLLTKHPEKRKGVMRYLWEFINQLVQKKTMGFTLLHDAMLQYYLSVEPGSEEANEFLELLKGDEEYDLMKNLAFTIPGSRVVCMAFAYGNAKDRKLLLRAYKDTIGTMAFDPTAHTVILAALEVTDDTKLSAKSVYSELMAVKDMTEATDEQANDLVALATDVNARSIILSPFLDRYKGILRPAPLERIIEVQEIRKTTSKKDPAIRKSELAKTVSPICLSLIARKAASLVLSSFGCVFIYEVLVRSEEGDKTAALDAIADLASDPSDEVRKALESPAGGKMLKTLVQGGRFDFESKKVVLCEPKLHFVDKLWSRIEGGVLHWATGPGSFVVVSMLETEDWQEEKGKKALKRALAKEKPALEKAVKIAEAHEKKSPNSKGQNSKKGDDQDGQSTDEAVVVAKGAKTILALLG